MSTCHLPRIHPRVLRKRMISQSERTEEPESATELTLTKFGRYPFGQHNIEFDGEIAMTTPFKIGMPSMGTFIINPEAASSTSEIYGLKTWPRRLSTLSQLPKWSNTRHPGCHCDQKSWDVSRNTGSHEHGLDFFVLARRSQPISPHPCSY